MSRVLTRIIMLFVLVAATGGVVQAETRVALLIGNGAYQGVSPLANPGKDAALLAGKLEMAGFRVRVEADLSAERLRRALRDFAAEADQADWAVVYYAGHGLEFSGQNFLVPVDARLQADRDVPFETVSLEQLLDSVSGAKKLRLIILDACRNNPFVVQMRTSSVRSADRGLARIEPDAGTLVAYSARAGQVAQDGDGQNSPFAIALARAIETPGLEINKVFRSVRDSVLRQTNQRQEPYVYGSLPSDDFFFLPPVKNPDQRQLAAEPGPGDSLAQARFLQAQATGTTAAWDSFLATWPRGFYADLARSERRRLAAMQVNRIVTSSLSAQSGDTKDFGTFLRDYAGGPCFAARLMEGPAADGTVRIEAFGKDPVIFAALDRDFKERFGAEAMIKGRLVSAAQCTFVANMNRLGWGSEQGLQVYLKKARVTQGQRLAGTVSGLGSRPLSLFALTESGELLDMAPAVMRKGDIALFSSTTDLVGNDGERPQLLIAVAGALPRDRSGPSSVTSLARTLSDQQKKGSAAPLAVAYWKSVSAQRPTDGRAWRP